MNRFFVCGWGGEAKVEIRDGGWGEDFWSKMEGDVKVKIEDGGWGKGFLSEMEGEGDGFKSERWRVREKMEGDRALGFKMCLRKKKKKKNEGVAQKKVFDKRPMVACIKRGHSSIQKTCGCSSKKRGFRRFLRPRV